MARTVRWQSMRWMLFVLLVPLGFGLPAQVFVYSYGRAAESLWEHNGPISAPYRYVFNWITGLSAVAYVGTLFLLVVVHARSRRLAQVGAVVCVLAFVICVGGTFLRNLLLRDGADGMDILLSVYAGVVYLLVRRELRLRAYVEGGSTRVKADSRDAG